MSCISSYTMTCLYVIKLPSSFIYRSNLYMSNDFRHYIGFSIKTTTISESGYTTVCYTYHMYITDKYACSVEALKMISAYWKKVYFGVCEEFYETCCLLTCTLCAFFKPFTSNPAKHCGLLDQVLTHIARKILNSYQR